MQHRKCGGKMNKDAELTNKRKWLKHQITTGIDGLMDGLIFDRVSHILQNLSRTSNLPSPYFTTAVIALLIMLPGLAATIALGESEKFRRIGLINLTYLGFSLIALIAARINLKYFFENMREYIVDSINSTDDLSTLDRSLSKFWSVRNAWLFGLFFGLILATAVVKFTSDSTGSFIGTGTTISTLIASTLNGVVVFYVFQMLFLPWSLGQYHFELHEPNPSHSIVIMQLSHSFNTYTYILAVYAAAFTLWVGSNPITASSNAIVLFTNWLPLVAQFIGNHVSMGRIISTAKWGILGKVERQIRSLQDKAKTMDRKTAEQISQLSDYHERISKTPDTALDVGAGLSFLNQLLLPLLAIGIANWKEILAFLR
jgi:hypothetical protein